MEQWQKSTYSQPYGTCVEVRMTATQDVEASA
jgi:Domain of unknown function (DUF397)